MTLRKTPPLEKLNPRMAHTSATQRQLKDEGLPSDQPLWVTSSGRVRHLTMNDRGIVNKTLCNLFRRGSSVMRPADRSGDEALDLCGACLRTLEAEVFRAKEAMKS